MAGIPLTEAIELNANCSAFIPIGNLIASVNQRMATKVSAEHSIDLVQQFSQDVFNNREYTRMPERFAEDCVQHGPVGGMEIQSLEEYEETLRMFHTAFSDLESTEEIVFSDDTGKFVCTVYTNRGTHDGELMGIPPTHVNVEVPGIAVHRVAEGKLVETWVAADFHSLLQQIGVAPSPDEYAA